MKGDRLCISILVSDDERENGDDTELMVLQYNMYSMIPLEYSGSSHVAINCVGELINGVRMSSLGADGTKT